ncbi:hypothetical protein Tco_1373653, partial [Tanacetum coccineum]
NRFKTRVIMASRPHIDDDDDFDGDFATGTNQTTRTGTKRGFGDIDDDEDDIFGPKKVQHFVISVDRYALPYGC